MPDSGAHGMDPDVVFPAEYRLLQIPWEQAMAGAQHELARQRDKLAQGRTGRALRFLLTVPSTGVTDGELAAGVGGTSAGYMKMALIAHGLVERVGGAPARFRLTAAGRKFAEAVPDEGTGTPDGHPASASE